MGVTDLVCRTVLFVRSTLLDGDMHGPGNKLMVGLGCRLIPSKMRERGGMKRYVLDGHYYKAVLHGTWRKVCGGLKCSLKLLEGEARRLEMVASNKHLTGKPGVLSEHKLHGVQARLWRQGQ